MRDRPPDTSGGLAHLRRMFFARSQQKRSSFAALVAPVADAPAPRAAPCRRVPRRGATKAKLALRVCPCIGREAVKLRARTGRKAARAMQDLQRFYPWPISAIPDLFPEEPHCLAAHWRRWHSAVP